MTHAFEKYSCFTHTSKTYVCLYAHVLCQGPQPNINKSITISLKLETVWEIQGRYLCSIAFGNSQIHTRTRQNNYITKSKSCHTILQPNSWVILMNLNTHMREDIQTRVTKPNAIRKSTEESSGKQHSMLQTWKQKKRMQNSQLFCAGNQFESSRELGVVFPTLIMREYKADGARPSDSNIIWQVFLTIWGSTKKRSGIKN